MEIAIVGAGPIGCYTGYLLAKSGQKVSIYEEHSQIGTPIQCTGLLTADFQQFGLPRDSLNSFLVNTFNEIEINSPKKKKLKIKQDEYLICRNKFDNYLANLALKAGAKIFLNNSFLRKEGKSLILKDSINRVKKEISPNIVIAADGPLSKVAKAYGFYQQGRMNYYGVQAVVEGSFEQGKYQAFFGKDICPGLFAWIVPESEKIARVGLATTKKTKFYFDKFIQEKGFQVKEIQAGTIPVYDPKQKLYQDNCYLLGDASSFVKATTLGGIIPGMKQAQILVDCINTGKDYEKEAKSLRRKMDLHLKLRKTFNKFSDSDWDKLFSLVGQEKVQRILKKHTRENPLPILLKALLKEPKLLCFVKHLF